MTHDYTKTGWGHSFDVVTPAKAKDDVARWCGWGFGISNGDLIRTKMASGKIARWEVLSVSYFSDPADMWKADVRFLDYEDVS